MQQAWENVATLLNEMRPLLLEAGIPERQVEMPKGRLPDQIKIEQYAKAFDWLHNFQQSVEYGKLAYAWGLVRPEIWKRYKLNGITGLREQLILDEAKIGVRKLWKRSRPSFFGRTYKVQDDENQETPSDQN